MALPIVAERARRRVLLVHLDRAGDVLPRVNLMPMGLVSIAAYLEARGHHARVIHEGLERRANPAFALESYARDFDVAGLTLHWHQQATRVIEAARALRRASPSIVTVLGGFTASRFAEELLRDHPEVDFVIKGDGELPFAELLERLAEGGALDAVPNLVYRDDAGVHTSTTRHQVDEEGARALDFTRFDLVARAEEYQRLRMDSAPEDADRAFSFSAGRGCEAACLYCGGGRAVQRKYQHRARTVMFPVDHVADQLQRMAESGATRWSTCFDPVPESDYYPRLFRELRARGLVLTAIFDSFALPSPSFVAEFAATFAARSAINLSPEVGSEALRKRLRTWSYDNDALFAAIADITAHGVGCSVYFSSGFPFETRADLAATIALAGELRRRFPGVQIHAGAIDLEPGSPLFDHQEQLGITSDVRDLRSLLASQRESRGDPALRATPPPLRGTDRDSSRAPREREPRGDPALRATPPPLRGTDRDSSRAPRERESRGDPALRATPPPLRGTDRDSSRAPREREPRELRYATRALASDEILEHLELVRIEAACRLPRSLLSEALTPAALERRRALAIAREACAPCGHHAACFAGREPG